MSKAAMLLFAAVAACCVACCLSSSRELPTIDLPDHSSNAFARTTPSCAVKYDREICDAPVTSLIWVEQPIDHFSWRQPISGIAETLKQRVFVNTHHWKNSSGPIFFYAGNEADVTLYVNHTGLMWENAEAFEAMIVFAEHRFYGETMPTLTKGTPVEDAYPYLTHEQAMADYANLLTALKQQHATLDTPVIVFGGSYGGMLAAWLRFKYPHLFTGAIAASAPVLAFPGQKPAYDSNTYWQVVTRDATPEAGTNASKACVDNVRRSWQLISDKFSTSSGRKSVSSIFGLCDVPKQDEDINLAFFLLMAWDTMAMGNFPYPSNYLTNGKAMLPAFPVTAACSHLDTPLEGDQLLAAIRSATDVFNNATMDVSCYTPPSDIEQDGIWDWQVCTELLPQETYFSLNGTTDMFFPHPYNLTFMNERCKSKFDIMPKSMWMDVSYGGIDAWKQTSNIIFSNGMLDPWSSAGIRKNLTDTVQAIEIPFGAHHVDLFFTNANDTPDITFARQFHLNAIRRWLKEHSFLMISAL